MSFFLGVVFVVIVVTLYIDVERGISKLTSAVPCRTEIFSLVNEDKL